MKINAKLLSIPPYISTAWKNVASLHIENEEGTLVLIVLLVNGKRIAIPGIHLDILKAVFAAHARSIEIDNTQKIAFPAEQIVTFGFPVTPTEEVNFGSSVQHNPDQADSPDLPTEFLEKISLLSQTLGIKDSSLIPQPHADCNCMHCQIARALQNGLIQEAPIEEEIVTDEDLKFRTWDIHQTGEKLYSVTNPLDAKEQYNVYLGEPVGCTCGQAHCEHIRAVLIS